MEGALLVKGLSDSRCIGAAPGRIDGTNGVEGAIFGDLKEEKMELCGDADFPAQFILPKAFEKSGGANRHNTVLRSMLRDALSKIKEDTNLVTSNIAIYSPAGDKDAYDAVPILKSMSSEGFTWTHNTARGLVSLPLTALDLR